LATSRAGYFQTQQHEDLRAVDLPGLVGVEGARDDGAQLRAGIGGPFVHALVQKLLGDLQLGAELDMIGDLHLHLAEPVHAHQRFIALGAAQASVVFLRQQRFKLADIVKCMLFVSRHLRADLDAVAHIGLAIDHGDPVG